jgi:hypothetical protein
MIAADVLIRMALRLPHLDSTQMLTPAYPFSTLLSFRWRKRMAERGQLTDRQKEVLDFIQESIGLGAIRPRCARSASAWASARRTGSTIT